MPARRLILASASPARARLLVAAGFEPEIDVSGVDEEAVGSAATADGHDVVLALAEAKAADVAGRSGSADALVVGCDSLFWFGGRVWGKPHDTEQARRRIQSMAGGEGVLRTGHWLIDNRTGRSSGAVEATTVRFAAMSDREVDAYVATGEPLAVAGSFTLDGRSSVFVEGIEGDHSNVIGLSLPLLRRLLIDVGVEVTSLWR